jgi:hypothetical protein
MNFLQFLVSRHLGLFLYNIVYLSSSLIGEQLHHLKFVSSLLIGATNLLARWHSICSADTKIGTLSVHVSAHGDCTVAKGFNQYSVACKNKKILRD